MITLIQMVGFIGFFVCLIIMYMTKLGIKGIRQYEPLFHLPDMKFHYSVQYITQTLSGIGENGRAIYQNYLYLDFVFTICFLIVMITATQLLITKIPIRSFLYVVCLLRALFDTLENLFLLLLLKNYPVIHKPMISICSYFTSVKFIMLYIWILLLSISIMRIF